MPRALVVQTSFLGDVVLTTPLLRELAQRGPVTVVVTPAAAPLLAGNPHVARLVTYDKRGTASGLSGFVRLARAVSTADRSDVAFLAQGSHRSGALARLAGYRQRVGLATSDGRPWYSTRIGVPSGTHHAERLWRLAGNSRLPTAEELRPRLYPSAEDVEAVAALLSAHGATDQPLIALAPGSVWGTKRWPGFGELAARLALLGRVVIVGGPDDRELAVQIAERAPGAILAAGELPLLASAALIGRCRALVTNDSLPLHLASAMDTPTVAIFGPTTPAFGFGPRATRHAVAEVQGLTCRPCDQHGPRVCPLGHFRCMKDLTAERVLAAVVELCPS